MIARGLLLALALASATPGAATIRALFVGIDNYAVRAGDADPPAQLRGPVNDVTIIKAALARHYGIDVRPAPPAGDCQARSASAITLINQCASRAALLAALDAQIAAAASGDLILFYFAGHGSFFADAGRSAGQERRNSTLLPHDARAGSPGDIYDVELRDRLYTANARVAVPLEQLSRMVTTLPPRALAV
jgi:Caspase domain